MSESQGTRRWGWVVGLVLVALIVAALVIGLSRNYSPEPTITLGGQTSDPRVGLELYELGERTPLPELSGQDLDGQPLSTADYPGKILVLNVWGSWCAPCRAEAPDLASTAKETAPRGVQFLGIDTRDNVASAQAFVRRYAITYPSFDESASNSSVLLELAGVVPLSAVPSTVFVDASGGIAARVIGQIDGSTLEGIVEDLLAERDASPSSS